MEIGGVHITPQVIADELRERTSVVLALAPARLSDSSRSPAPVLLTCESKRRAPPHSSITLFGQSIAMSLLRARVEVRQCKSCFSFAHNTNDCRMPAPRCARCNSKSHGTASHSCTHCGQPGICSHPALCAICPGPHPADSPQCPLRPRFSRAAGCLVTPDAPNTALLQEQQSKLYSHALAAAKKRTRAEHAAAVKSLKSNTNTTEQKARQLAPSDAGSSSSDGGDAMDMDNGASNDADSVASGPIAEAIESLPLPAPPASEPLEASIAEAACNKDAHAANSSAPRCVESPDPIGIHAPFTEAYEAYLARPNPFVLEATSKRNPRWRAIAPLKPSKTSRSR